MVGYYLCSPLKAPRSIFLISFRNRVNLVNYKKIFRCSRNSLTFFLRDLNNVLPFEDLKMLLVEESVFCSHLDSRQASVSNGVKLLLALPQGRFYPITDASKCYLNPECFSPKNDSFHIYEWLFYVMGLIWKLLLSIAWQFDEF